MLAILPTPAKPDGAGSKNTGYSGHTVPSGLNREESETDGYKRLQRSIENDGMEG